MTNHPNTPSAGGPSSGGYRDEREAALAQVSSLQQRNAALESEVQHLRAHNEALRRENAALGGTNGAAAPRRATALVLGIVSVFVLMLVGAGAFFALARAAPDSTPPYNPAPVSIVPSAMPSAMPEPPSIAPQPPSLPQTTPPTVPPSTAVQHNLPLAGT
jgi:hypothetical protein